MLTEEVGAMPRECEGGRHDDVTCEVTGWYLALPDEIGILVLPPLASERPTSPQLPLLCHAMLHLVRGDSS